MREGFFLKLKREGEFERKRKETQEDKTDRRGERQTEGETIETGGRRERKAQKKINRERHRRRNESRGTFGKLNERSEWRAEKERISETEGGKIQTHQHC
jgi:hypothetical protein